MAIDDVRLVLTMPRTGLKGADFPTLVMLAWHKNERTGQCNPSYEKLAHEVCVSPDTAARAIRNLKKLGIVEYQSGNGNTSNEYCLHITSSIGIGSPPAQCGLSAGVGSERMGGEPLELNTSVSVSDSISVSVEGSSSSRMTEDKRQQQTQEQRQQPRHGGTTPEPPFEKDSPLSVCLELERVWKEVTEAPCYPRNFVPLLAQYTADHIASVIRWVFTISNYWTIKNTGAFCKRASGQFPVFDKASVQYERYMHAVREGAEERPNLEASQKASQHEAVLDDEVLFEDEPGDDTPTKPDERPNIMDAADPDTPDCAPPLIADEEEDWEIFVHSAAATLPSRSGAFSPRRGPSSRPKRSSIYNDRCPKNLLRGFIMPDPEPEEEDI